MNTELEETKEKTHEEVLHEQQTKFIPENVIAPDDYEYYRSHAMDSDIYIRPIKSMKS